jgi:hypothetical protein
MRLAGISATVVALAAGAAQAQQYLINELSFGHAGRCVVFLHSRNGNEKNRWQLDKMANVVYLRYAG